MSNGLFGFDWKAASEDFVKIVFMVYITVRYLSLIALLIITDETFLDCCPRNVDRAVLIYNSRTLLIFHSPLCLFLRIAL